MARLGRSAPSRDVPRARRANRAPVGWLLAAAVLLPVAIIAFSGWASWNAAWRQAEGELVRTADGAAEYADRVLGSHVLAARLVNQMLAGLTDEQIRADEAALQARLAGLMPTVPMIRSISLGDRNAEMLLMADRHPVPRVSIADREWVQVLQGPEPPEVHISSVTEGRLLDSLYFGVSVRRTGTGNLLPDGAFDGIVNISIDPGRLAAGFQTITHDPQDVIALVRADGEVLVSRLDLTERPPPVPAGSPLLAAAAAGVARGTYAGRSIGLRDSLAAGQRLIIAFRQVGDLPVYVTVSRPPAAVIAPWRRTMAGLMGVGLPATLALAALAFGVRRSQRGLAASEAEFRAAFEASAVGNALFDPGSGRLRRVNRRLGEITGRSQAELLGMTLAELVPGEEGAGGPPDAPGEVTIRLERPDGAMVWVQVDIAPIRYRARGLPPLSIASLHDVTHRKESEARHRMLAREVDHRAKNALAIVKSIVRLSTAPDLAAYVEAVRGRVMALARAHDLLSSNGWRGAEMAALAETALEGSRDRVTLDGPAVAVGVRAVQPLAMALHELATNAERHGALSVPGGSVAATWRSGDGVLRLVWAERGGPPVAEPPASGGVGLRLLRGLIAQLDGEVALRWEAEGATCEIVVPLERAAHGWPGEPAG